MSVQMEPAIAFGTEYTLPPHSALRPWNPDAEEIFLTDVYSELRTLAARNMLREVPGHTLEPMELVHEAWLRLFSHGRLHCPNRAYFFAAAALAMRRILVEQARRSKRLKRGGNLERVELDDLDLASPVADDDLLVVDEALTRFAKAEPRAAELVNLLFFAELTQKQAAQELGVSVSTVERRWAFARAWLFREIQKSRRDR